MSKIARIVIFAFTFWSFSFSAWANADVTFCVDVSCLTNITAVNIFGTFNGWDPNINPLTDPDGDDIYCVTINMTDGPQEFKFLVNGFEERFNSGETCTITSGPFVNRLITVVNGVPQTLTYGFNRCQSDCVSTNVTFCVDVGCISPINQVTLFGTFNNWDPFANSMADPDGDGIYCTTLLFPYGPHEYKFLFDGAQESFAGGESCTITSFGFTNRIMNVTDSNPFTISFGYNACDAACVAPNGATMEFCVDMNCTLLSPTNINIFGSFNGWSPNSNALTDPDGDGIYCGSIFMEAGDQEFKFLSDGVEEIFNDGDPCTVTNFGFTNRVVSVVAGMGQTVSFEWETCEMGCFLPVELIYFEGNARSSDIELRWATGPELNHTPFEIQHSGNAIDFYTILSRETGVNASEIQEYAATDQQPLPGTNYYRLKQIENDGSIWYSEIISVDFKRTEAGFSFFPNPAGDVIHLQSENLVSDGPIKLFDLAGALVGEWFWDKNQNVMTINVGFLPGGIYYIVSEQKGTFHTEKLVLH
ncbi:MAG: T9SS type A sorting domain-containing protein [Bacteroidota bacterium]